jgi:uncharacterized protein YjbI with pentapeptide repeats
MNKRQGKSFFFISIVKKLNPNKNVIAFYKQTFIMQRSIIDMFGGGSKCSVIKEKPECESNEDCVWGKTGKCSVKRKPGAKAKSTPKPRTKAAATKSAASASASVAVAVAAPAPTAEGSPRSSHDDDEELVQKTKEDFQPGATLKNVRANGDVDLKGRDMKGIKIVGGNMVGVDLRGADLSGATLENIMFHNAKLDGANLTGATIRGCIFEEASVKEARFSGARITESDMNKLSSAEKAQFNDSVLTDAWFSGSKFREANFANAKFEGAETQLNGVSFEKANLTGASFGEGVGLTIPPNMLSAHHDRDYAYINFNNANLQKVKFSPNGTIANLAYNHFEGANLTGANLAEADLRYCKFKGAIMTDTNLSMADLRDSELSVSALKDAYINGAIFNTLEMHKGGLRFED